MQIFLNEHEHEDLSTWILTHVQHAKRFGEYGNENGNSERWRHGAYGAGRIKSCNRN